jgi:hypothetical protein
MITNRATPPGGCRHGARHSMIDSAPPVFHGKMPLGIHDPGGPGNFFLSQTCAPGAFLFNNRG